ncbi:endothiapepsin-like protein [Moelleriella libera RCEF 2490]|uniref:Endothiapepsin-like protein n=1 Tax=Moelleriella libera RCEF 2490 TaxID=1081109 RepID=A0A166V3G9_9HYPO|nr:endothiapepsin-like protein [Moelleriella libera RCEF 2490]
MSSFSLQASIQVADNVSDDLRYDPDISGIMGLARSLLTSIVPPTENFLSELWKQLDRPVIGVDLRRNASSRFTFGHYTAPDDKEFTWLNAHPKSAYWDFSLNRTLVQGSWHSLPFTATLDTGTSLMYLPRALVDRYWASVPGSRMEAWQRKEKAYMFPCNLTSLPQLAFDLGGGHEIHVPGKMMNYTAVEDSGFCWGGLQSEPSFPTDALLGDVFLHAVHAAFDFGANRVGLASKMGKEKP